jgi:Putative Ig domain
VISAIATQTLRTGDLVALRVQASDPQQHSLIFGADNLPKGLAIHPSSGMIYGRLTTPGNVSSTIRAGNGASSASMTLQWNVADAASP